VSGTVRLDGKPLSAAGVGFHPNGGGAVASGTTDAEGRYRLETGSRPGVMPGEYRVTVSKTHTSGISSAGLPLPGKVKTEHLIPTQYDHPTTSPLQMTVNQGSQNYNIELTSNAVPSVR
jgi:hypothetical protein